MQGRNRLRAAVENQGYTGLSDQALVELDPWLRVAPAFSAGWTVVATAMASPRGVLLLAALTALGALLPRHPFDLPYHLVVRHWIGGPALPPTPTPRRVASLMATGWLFLTGLAFAAGRLGLGTLLGGSFTVVALIPVLFGVCLAAWSWTRVVGGRRDPSGSVDQVSS